MAQEQLLFADVLGTDAAKGEVRLKLGSAVDARGFSVEVPVYGPDGYIAFPNTPGADGSACQAIYAQDGDQQYVLGLRDNRFADKAGTLAPGDRIIVTDGPARIIVKKATSTVVLYSEDGDGNSLMVSVEGKSGEIKLVNAGSFLQLKKDEFQVAVNGGGGLRISKDGIQVMGNAFQAIAGAVQLGDQGGGTPATTPVGIGPSPATVASSKVFAALLVFVLTMLAWFGS